MKLAFNDTYTHFIFITNEKIPLISEKLREPLEIFITKIVNNNGCRMCAIYANPEHVHFLISRSPDIAEAHIANMIASRSCNFIKNGKFCNQPFLWKNDAAAFSVSNTEVEELCRFIHFQPEYHRELSFEQEYNEIFMHYHRRIDLDDIY